MSNSASLNWDSALQLMPVLVDFYEAKKAKEDIELIDAVEKVAGALGIDNPEEALKTLVSDQLGDALNRDGAEEMAAVVAAAYKPVLQLAGDFAKGGMESRTLLDGINSIYLDSLSGLEGTLEKAVGFQIPDGIKALLGKYELAAVSIYCFAAAYKIYRKAADDAALAHDRRIEIKRLCSESIAQLKERRLEMEALVNTYMLDRLIPFAQGVSAMDAAVLADDDDGYIAANAEIWALLGRESQYENAEEFDDLMLSDETFKL